MFRTYVGFQGGVIESCILEFNVSPFKIPRSELIYPIFCLRTVIPLWLFKKGSGPGSLGPRITETSVFDWEIKCWCVKFGWKTIRRGGGAKKEPTELILQHPYPLCQRQRPILQPHFATSPWRCVLLSPWQLSDVSRVFGYTPKLDINFSTDFLTRLPA